MPWTVDDVNRFKKGLTAKQKKQWVAVANSVLEKCRKDGGSNCEAKAIRQASGSVNVEIMEEEILVQIAINKSSQVTYQPTTVLVENKQYLIVPVVMMVEGVHNGSGGAIYHSAEELGKSADSWQDIPVVINHPILNGSYVSINTTGIAEAYQVGHISEPVMKNEKLTAKVYLDVQKLTAISPETLLAVQEGKVLEVSIGVFTEDEEIEGEWNGETYQKIARNHIPDHLAILPEEVGACSVKDGCGLRVNNEKKGGMLNVIEVNEKFLKDLTLQGYSAILLTQAEGLQERVEKVRASLYSKDSNENEYYIEEVFDTYAVFRKYVRVKEGDYWKTTDVQLFKQVYQVNADGSIEWVGEPVKVVRNVEYVTVNNEKLKTMCEVCKEKVNELIANESTHFNESNREWLESLTEDKLDLLIPKLVKTNTSTPSYEDAVKIVQANAKSLDDYLGILPENIKAEVQVGLNAFKEKKDALIATIQANTEKDTWNVDELNVMSLQVLQKIEKSVVKADYSVNRASGGNNTKEKVEPLILP